MAGRSVVADLSVIIHITDVNASPRPTKTFFFLFYLPDILQKQREHVPWIPVRRYERVRRPVVRLYL